MNKKSLFERKKTTDADDFRSTTEATANVVFSANDARWNRVTIDSTEAFSVIDCFRRTSRAEFGIKMRTLTLRFYRL